MRNDLAIYLRLAPEFGGTRFGPFEGIEVVLGSEAGRCDITIPDSLGVLPVHVRVLRQPDMSMILAPAERTASVFLWKQGSRKPVQVQTPTAVRSGDAFALVTEQGPRFAIELDELPEAMKAEREAKKSLRRKRLSTGAFKAEAKRQAFTRILVTGPGQMVQRAWTFIKSGAIFQPRYIFLGIALLGGYVWGGSMSCNARKHKKNWATTTVRLEECKGDVAFAQNMGDTETSNVPELVARVVDSTQVGRALAEDDVLRSAVLDAARTLLTQLTAYDWLLEGKDPRAATFAEWREAVYAEERLDPDFVLVAPYAGVEPNLRKGSWSRTEDSVGQDVCTRGPGRMTYRQAVHLGLLALPDALVTGDVETFHDDKPRREEVLLATVRAAGGLDLPEAFESAVVAFQRNRNGCVHVTGEDDRERRDRVIAAMVRHLGEEVPGLPGVESPHSVSARLARFFAADIPDMDLTREGATDFSQFPVGTITKGLGSKGDWVLARTAETLARAFVLPCEATLRPGVDRKLAEKTFGRLPDAIPCLVLDYRLRNAP